jgi:Flp pilus assembly protein TadD
MRKGSIIFVVLLAIVIIGGSVRADTDRCADAVKEGKFRDAIVICTKQIEGGAGGKHSAVYRNRGIAYLETGQSDLAIADFSKALGLNPNEEETYNDRGAAYLGKGWTESAIGDFSRAIRLNPKNAEPYRNRGAAHMADRRFDAARDDFQKAVELDPADSRGYYNMACLYSLQKNDRESCSWLQKAIDHGYSNWGHLKQDPDLEHVRNEECYRAIVKGK